MITPKNVLRHELVGLNVRVVSLTHKGYECGGVVIGETKNTMRIRTSSGVKTVPKDCVVAQFELPGGETVRVDGRLLTAKPEERIKKKYRIRFI